MISFNENLDLDISDIHVFMSAKRKSCIRHSTVVGFRTIPTRRRIDVVDDEDVEETYRFQPSDVSSQRFPASFGRCLCAGVVSPCPPRHKRLDAPNVVYEE